MCHLCAREEGGLFVSSSLGRGGKTNVSSSHRIGVRTNVSSSRWRGGRTNVLCLHSGVGVPFIKQ